MAVENRRPNIEELQALFNLGRISIAGADKLFNETLPDQQPGALAPFTETPQLPTGDVGARPVVGRPEIVAGLLRCQVLHDRAGLPQDEIAVFKCGNLAVWIDAQECGLALLTAGKIDLL